MRFWVQSRSSDTNARGCGSPLSAVLANSSPQRVVSCSACHWCWSLAACSPRLTQRLRDSPEDSFASIRATSPGMSSSRACSHGSWPLCAGCFSRGAPSPSPAAERGSRWPFWTFLRRPRQPRYLRAIDDSATAQRFLSGKHRGRHRAWAARFTLSQFRRRSVSLSVRRSIARRSFKHPDLRRVRTSRVLRVGCGSDARFTSAAALGLAAARGRPAVRDGLPQRSRCLTCSGRRRGGVRCAAHAHV